MRILVYDKVHAGLSQLPLKVRLAVGAWVLEEVGRQYSDYFTKKFKHRANLDTTWGRICGNPLCDADAQRITRATKRLVVQAEREGYSRAAVMMSALLALEGVPQEDRREIGTAIDMAANAYESLIIYSCNTSSSDPRVWKRGELTEPFQVPVWELALSGIERVRAISDGRLSLDTFHGLVLPDAKTCPLPPELATALKRKNPNHAPPIHERPSVSRFARR